MINNSPFFSVVIPVYNKEPHIARSISYIFVAFILALIVLCLSMKFVDNKKAFEY